MRWLSAHWRAANVICVCFQGRPLHSYPEVACEAPASASAAGSAHVLRVTVDGPSGKRYKQGVRPVDPAGNDVILKLPRWVAGVASLCQNLTALHLRGMVVEALPALPLLMHVVLEQCMFRPALVASLQGLARLETLHASGCWGAAPPVWDVRACLRLRRVYLEWGLAEGLAAAGQELFLPPACTVALDLHEDPPRPWLVHLGSRIVDLRLHFLSDDVVTVHQTYMHAPELSQLRHVTLHVTCVEGSLCVARLLGGLPQTVESLHLRCPWLLSEQAIVVVPARLRALRIKGVCDGYRCRRGCCCPPQDLTFGLHARLERLCLVLSCGRVGLQCLDACAPAGLRELNVQARVVHMDAQLAAEVACRGRVLARCDVLDRWWDSNTFRCAHSARGAHWAGPRAHGGLGGPCCAAALGLHVRGMRQVPGA